MSLWLQQQTILKKNSRNRLLSTCFITIKCGGGIKEFSFEYNASYRKYILKPIQDMKKANENIPAQASSSHDAM